jgi:hypothetical protein
MLRSLPRLMVGLLLVAVVVASALRSNADTANSKEDAAQTKAAPAKKCPMMAGLSSLRLFADSPAALLARAEELGLDVKQRRRLEEIEEAARLQARKLLSDKQWEQLHQAPSGRLSMMEMARIGMQGKKMDGCCPMCLKMMRAEVGKTEQKQDRKTEAKAKEAKENRKAKSKG